ASRPARQTKCPPSQGRRACSAVPPCLPACAGRSSCAVSGAPLGGWALRPSPPPPPGEFSAPAAGLHRRRLSVARLLLRFLAFRSRARSIRTAHPAPATRARPDVEPSGPRGVVAGGGPSRWSSTAWVGGGYAPGAPTGGSAIGGGPGSHAYSCPVAIACIRAS